MITRLLLTVIAASLCVTFCQGQERSAEKKKQDSADALKFRKQDPAVYQNNIAPIFLEDKTCIIRGHSTVLRIENDGYGDSVRRNYHTTMPGETSNVVPLASFTVGGEKIKVQLRLYDLLFTGLKNESRREMHITPLLELKGNKEIFNQYNNNKSGIDAILIHYLVRISVNNEPIIAWAPFKSFSSNIYKVIAGFKIKNRETTFTVYDDVYDFLNTTLAINDQLFIEIKDDRTGWMVDSYNITRKEMSPKVSLILPNSNGIILAEKKTSF